MNIWIHWVAWWTFLFLLTTGIVALRLWTRYHNKQWGSSDALATLCLVLGAVMYGVAIATGYSAYRPTDPDMRATSEQIILIAFFYRMSAAFLVPLSKVCVIFLLLEVEVKHSWRRVLYTLQILILCTGLVNVVLTFFGCVPVGDTMHTSRYWSVLATDSVERVSDQFKQQKCVVRTQLIPINGGLNVLYEVLIFFCATSLVLRVKTSRLQKLGLALFFTMGFIIVGATAMSTYQAFHIYLRQIQNESVRQLSFYRFGLYVAFEAYTSLTVASLLPIKACLARSFDVLGNRMRALRNRRHRVREQEDSSLDLESFDKPKVPQVEIVTEAQQSRIKLSDLQSQA